MDNTKEVSIDNITFDDAMYIVQEMSKWLNDEPPYVDSIYNDKPPYSREIYTRSLVVIAKHNNEL